MAEKEIGQYMVYDKSSRMINTLYVQFEEGKGLVDPRDKETLDRGVMGSHVAWADKDIVGGQFTDNLEDYKWSVNEDCTTILKDF